MFKQNSLNKKRVVFATIISIVLLVVVVAFIINNNSSQAKSQKIENSKVTNSKTEQNVITNQDSQPKLDNLKIYLSIANSPEALFISKTYTDINSVKVDVVVENYPQTRGLCNLDIYSLQGVEVHKINSFSFGVNANSSSATSFNLAEGTFRTEFNCDFEGNRYSKIYTAQININKTSSPISYAI